MNDKGQSGHPRMWTPHFVGCLKDHNVSHISSSMLV
jgi:hypothetical protein